MKTHIFIIGYNKTATTSLHRLFVQSGYPSIHFAGGRMAPDMISNICNERRALHGYDELYAIFSDMMYVDYHTIIECNEYFEILAKDYPEAKFIYNFRDLKSWLRSRSQHSNFKMVSFLDRYRSALNLRNDEEVFEVWAKQRMRLEERLQAYFKDSDKLLMLDVDHDDVPLRIQDFADVSLDARHWQRHNVTGSVP